MSTPVWTWLPGSSEPVLAAHVALETTGGRFTYDAAYRQMPNARPLDPMRLRITASAAPMRIPGDAGLPGVILDAMPAGYGRDRLQARFDRELTPLELLEHGAGDAVGAIAVCRNIEAKMTWRPHRLSDLIDQLESLDDDTPSSRAIRRMGEDDGTAREGIAPK